MPDGAKPPQVSKAVIRNAPPRDLSRVKHLFILVPIAESITRAVPFFEG